MWRRPHKPPNKSIRDRATTCTPFILVLFLFTAILILYKNKGTHISPFSDPQHKVASFQPENVDTRKPISPFTFPELKWDTFSSSVQFNPSTAIRNGTDVIWQIPNSTKAALFIAHGCNGHAVNFWDRSPQCQNCVGLPEERLLVLHALQRRFAVLTVSSLGRCWTFGKEMDNVKGIIEWWVNEKGLGQLPLVALGASSGGYFVSALATKIKFSSIALMIAEGVFDSMEIPKGYPPTLFVHMPKDRDRESMVEVNMAALKREGVPVKEIRCMEFPLTPTFLSDRIPALERSLSVKLFEIFRRKNFVDEKGLMRKDGRATPWRQELKQNDPSLDWADHIQEELNLAYAYHEMTSLEMEEILAWFESYMGR